MKRLLILIGAMGITATEAQTYIDANVGINTSWSSVGLNVNSGYMFNRYVGLEGGATFSPGYSYYWGPNYAYSANYWMLDAAVKGVFPLNKLFSVFAKVGVAFNNYSGSQNCGNSVCGSPYYSGSNFGVLLGGGAVFNLNSNWALHLADYASLGANPNFFDLGIQYNF